jgi:hypothetical protein
MVELVCCFAFHHRYPFDNSVTTMGKIGVDVMMSLLICSGIPLLTSSFDLQVILRREKIKK